MEVFGLALGSRAWRWFFLSLQGEVNLPTYAWPTLAAHYQNHKRFFDYLCTFFSQ
jgi:hypothetical protein